MHTGTRENPPAPAPLRKTWLADDGTILTLRPVTPADWRIAKSFVRGLSFGARYFRFGCGEAQFTEEELLCLCTPNPCTCAHFIVVTVEDGTEVEIGSAHYTVQPGGKNCEFAIVVADGWRGRGIGHRLMEALLQTARSKGLGAMYGRILATNQRMIECARRWGFDVSKSLDSAAVTQAVRSLG